MKNLPQKTLERKFVAQGHDSIIGVDEVGMGCLAGPVVVCATLVRAPFFNGSHPQFRSLRDSKLLSAGQRENYVRALGKDANIMHVLVTIPPRDVDTYNVLQAARRGMAMAVRRLVRRSGAQHPAILVDGNRLIPDISWFQKTIVSGDRKIFSIACASIVAKVYRDALMVRASKKYPDYGFEIHKGYGTRMHYARLLEHGPCPLHRQSFRLTGSKKSSKV